MGFLKRLFGKKDTTQETRQESNEKTDTNEQDKPAEKEKHRKYHVSMNRDEKSENHMMWRVRIEESDKTIKHFKTQEEAINYAEDLADDSGASVVIHKKDGSIRRQNYRKHS